ncbi:thiamine-phosphate kinase [Alicyclobacillus sp. ALC3]|uniref:thiamine-phosphate kinase n=1 Tax=Alicyclobacillus sp. ALC3 TaxID=2796143 RepID=UPI00237978C5|nr:thiamine-phosphate kinase [Alicyclobacillus sp. ALC3]WDL95459.1 thiamine-phosphate kinase [Alicyclobacillus sp. ALC3]
MAQLGGLEEFGLIAHLTDCYRSRLQTRTQSSGAEALPVAGEVPGVRVDIGDDAAVLTVSSGEDLVLTTDTMVEGVHFLPETMDWSDVGYKAVAASVSDVAAMGGRARHVVLAIAIPEHVELASLEALYEGVADVCADTGCRLVGGDVVGTSGPFVVTSTVQGVVAAGQAVLRSGAQPGDVVFVTGTVGDSGAGLALQQPTVSQEAANRMMPNRPTAGVTSANTAHTPGMDVPRTMPSYVPADEAYALRQRHRRPRPQVEAGPILLESGATSMDDISDGLASELNEIAKASGVRLRIEAARVPLSPAVQNFARGRREDPLTYAWYGGEDYQLVGTAPPFAFARILARFDGVGVRVTQIGRVEPGDGEVVAVLPNGIIDLVEARGYNHFKESRGNGPLQP